MTGDLALLFAASLLAATLIPAQSEAVLAALQSGGDHDPLILLLVATGGNVLGACVNWLLGRYLLRFSDRRWFPVSQTSLARASARYRTYGMWSLLFSWLPIIGDPLTLVAGICRTPFPVFLLLVTIGKAGRYLVVLSLF